MSLDPTIFVERPLEYAEAGRVERLLSGHGLQEFADSPDALDRLNNYACSAWSLEPCDVEGIPADEAGAVLLMERQQLLNLADRLGAMIAVPKLRLLTDGKTMSQLKAALPGIYPECLQSAPLFRSWQKELEALSPAQLPPLEPESIRLAGMQLLASLIANCQTGLIQRWKLRLTPQEAAMATPEPGIPLPNSAELARLMA